MFKFIINLIVSRIFDISVKILLNNVCIILVKID